MEKNFILQAVFILFLLFPVSQTRAAGATDMFAGSDPAPSFSGAGEGGNGAEGNAGQEEEWEDEWEAADALADPLEPVNRLFFHFNDKLYYWVMKPVARVYSSFIPQDMQIVIRNFFDNLEAPVRAVNNLLQGNVRGSASEVARFTLNSTMGIIGLCDFAKDVFGLQSSNEDLGQTLAYYGAGGGFYINWPFLGPSNFRDSLGMFGDGYVHPLILLDADLDVTIGIHTFEQVNSTALTMGDYELFVGTALDPYAAVKDAYQQHRNGLIQNK